ncbi:MAG TPA: NAD(P)H-hydrate dehydratase [Novosphingobium sp.]|nr:NAD(P)H-hydrate dehydratase [Novosphingobium sp.]
MAEGGEPAPAEPTLLDGAWIRANPLPQPQGEVDKNSRGRVLVVGGCLDVPGGVRLTAEAALRAGAGKVRIATVAPVAVALGVLIPEAAVLALPVNEDGEIDAARAPVGEHLARCDALVVGPAMSCRNQASALVGAMLAQAGWSGGLIVDAAALMALAPHAEALRKRPAPAVLTPHIGEMAALLDIDAEAIAGDRPAAAREAARRYGAVVVLKGGTSLIADPSGALFAFDGGNVGLATGGSGDVLAGVVAALLARGCAPLAATLWAVWLHGEAGRRCAETIGPLGFLASELLGAIPQAMRSAGGE